MYEKLADDVVESLPENVYVQARKLKDFLGKKVHKSNVDQFWFRINRVYKAEIILKEKYSDNYMVSLWLGKQDGSWTTKYLTWLETCWGEDTKDYLYPYHIGPQGKPWKKWFTSEEDLADISDELYEEVT